MPPALVAGTDDVYRPHGGALALFSCRAREVLLEGPADTGKSRACLTKGHFCALKYPGMRWAIARKTRRSITESVQVTFDRFVNVPRVARLWGDLEYRYANGSVCVLLGLDDPEKQKSSEYDLVFVNEANELTAEDWEILVTRVSGRGATMPYTQLVGDLNPTDPGHHLYTREAAGHITTIPSRHEDNPSITPERIAALDALTGYRYQRLRLGLRVAAEGMFFPEFNPELHTCAPFPIPAHWPRWTGTDYGYRAPFAHYAAARDPETRRIYLFREIYAAGLRDHEQAAEITRRIRDERADLGVPREATLYARHVGDPSMFNSRPEADLPSIASAYWRAGIRLQKAGNNRRSGWQVVRAALAHGPDRAARLQIFRGRCPHLERTLPAMVHDPLDPEDLATRVDHQDAEDHAVDALRYLLVAEDTPPTRTRAVPIEVVV